MVDPIKSELVSGSTPTLPFKLRGHFNTLLFISPAFQDLALLQYVPVYLIH